MRRIDIAALAVFVRTLRQYPDIEQLFWQCGLGEISVRQLRNQIARDRAVAERRGWSRRADGLEELEGILPKVADRSRAQRGGSHGHA